jgi:hypothetical protein
MVGGRNQHGITKSIPLTVKSSKTYMFNDSISNDYENKMKYWKKHKAFAGESGNIPFKLQLL